MNVVDCSGGQHWADRTANLRLFRKRDPGQPSARNQFFSKYIYTLEKTKRKQGPQSIKWNPRLNPMLPRTLSPERITPPPALDVTRCPGSTTWFIQRRRWQLLPSLDLKWGYHQVPVREEDRDITTWITPFGVYRFKRMLFGLRNSGATFQRLIDQLRKLLTLLLLLLYLDDILYSCCGCYRII